MDARQAHISSATVRSILEELGRSQRPLKSWEFRSGPPASRAAALANATRQGLVVRTADGAYALPASPQASAPAAAEAPVIAVLSSPSSDLVRRLSKVSGRTPSEVVDSLLRVLAWALGLDGALLPVQGLLKRQRNSRRPPRSG